MSEKELKLIEKKEEAKNLGVNPRVVDKCENIACVEELINELFLNMVKELKRKQSKTQSPKLPKL